MLCAGDCFGSRAVMNRLQLNSYRPIAYCILITLGLSVTIGELSLASAVVRLRLWHRKQCYQFI